MRWLFVLNAVIFFLIKDVAHAQTLDSAAHVHHFSTYTTFDHIHDFKFEDLSEDTSLQFVHHIYSPRVKSAAWMDQGQIGTPGLNLINSDRWIDHFTLGEDYISLYGYKAEDTRYFSGEQPRSDLKYGQGTGDLIYLKAEHAQNVFERWSFGLDYTRIKANNVYYGNLVDFTKIRIPNSYYTRLYSRFYTANRKYEVLTSFNWNKSTMTETGGLQDAALFDTLEGRQKFYFNTANLVGATTKFQNVHWRIDQYWRDGDRKIKQGDSLIKDTTTKTIKAQWYHRMDLRWDITNFSDETATDLYYPVNYYSFITNDSNRSFSAVNRFGRNQRIAKNRIDYYTEYEFASGKQFPGHELKTNIIRLGADWHLKQGDYSYDLNSKFAATGYFQGDYYVGAKVKKQGDNIDMKAKLLLYQRELDFGTQFFGSNHIYWHESLKKKKVQQLMAKLDFKNLGLSLKLKGENIAGFVYFDTSGMPNQVEESVSRGIVELGHKAEFARIFTIDQSLSYQLLSSDIWRTPSLVYRGRIFAEGDMFNHNMRARLGVEAYYMSSFDGLTYNPITRRYQWDESRKSGAYPMFDIFLNAHVSTMQIFVHVQHATDGLFNYDFYSANGYPLMYRSFRLGLSWRLFN